MSEKEYEATGQEGEIVKLRAEVERLQNELACRDKSLEDLVERDQLCQEMVHHANSIILLWNPDGTIVFLNDFGLQFFGYEFEDIIGQNIVGTLIRERDFSNRDLTAMIEDIGRNPDKYKNNENENMTSNGSRVWVAWTNTLLDYKFNGDALVLSVGNDITARKKAEDNLATFHRFIESSGQGFGLASLDGTFNYVNPALCRMLGRETDQEVLGRSIYDFYPEDSCEIIRGDVIPRILEEDQWTGELDLITSQGASLPTIMNFFVVTDERGNPTFFANIITDITEQKEYEEELRRIATIDSLTGIYNRRHFMEMARRQIKLEKRYNRNWSMLMMDIDHFKQINDAYGHAVGDEALKIMASTTWNAIRETDIFGRLGGEEFGILLIGDNIDEAVVAAERIRRLISGIKIKTDHGTVSFTVSIGAAEGREGYDVETVLKLADAALYQAKHEGRNRVCRRN